MILQRLKVTINGAAHSLSVRPETSDMEVIRQVFEQQDYNTERLARGPELRAEYERMMAAGHMPVILDLGANIGAASLFFGAMWPGARIIAVEPAADNFELMTENLAAFDHVTTVQAAAASEDGHAAITDDTAEKWAYRTEISKAGAIPAVSVPSLLGEIENPAPFIAKIDIEGAETELFSSNTDWADTFALIIIELHDWMLPKSGSSKNFQKLHANLDRDLILAGENLYSVSNRI